MHEARDERLTTADLAGGAEQAQQQQPRPGPKLLEREQGVRETQAGSAERATPLFAEAETKDFRGRWDAIQAGFVDEPRRAVEQADSLVAATMKRLAEIFAREREGLEKQWDRGDNVSTEDLRQALRRYRSFFDRLLSV